MYYQLDDAGEIKGAYARPQDFEVFFYDGSNSDPDWDARIEDWNERLKQLEGQK